MQKTLKFLHVVGAIGFCGAIAALIVLHLSLPESAELNQFAATRIAMGAIAEWLLLPSMGVVIVSGLFAMAATDTYQNAGWVWVKLATGLLVFEGTLVAVQGPMERAASNAQAALAGEFDLAAMTARLSPERLSLWVILAVAAVNILLGVWRPRFSRQSDDD